MGKVGEINKQFTQTKDVTTTVTTTFDFKWIQATTEPTTPEGYTRCPELDINLGDLGKLWAFIKIS
jgi:hypothetical protein